MDKCQLQRWETMMTKGAGMNEFTLAFQLFIIYFVIIIYWDNLAHTEWFLFPLVDLASQSPVWLSIWTEQQQWSPNISNIWYRLVGQWLQIIKTSKREVQGNVFVRGWLTPSLTIISANKWNINCVSGGVEIEQNIARAFLMNQRWREIMNSRWHEVMVLKGSACEASSCIIGQGGKKANTSEYIQTN